MTGELLHCKDVLFLGDEGQESCKLKSKKKTTASVSTCLLFVKCCIFSNVKEGYLCFILGSLVCIGEEGTNNNVVNPEECLPGLWAKKYIYSHTLL